MTAKTMRAFVLEKGEGKPGQVYHPATVKQVPTPECKQDQVLVKIHAVAFNHRDLFCRRSLYPGIVFPSIMGSDAVGELVAPSSHPLYQKLVLIGPSIGWDESPLAPESKDGCLIYGSVGKGVAGRGTFAEYIAVEESRIVACPPHLTDDQNLVKAAAIPLGSVTAYRAVFSKGQIQAGQNVLITGIGGGVALQAMQFVIAAGANVYVTSGSQDKIDKAKSFGAKDGVSYKEDKWEKKLSALLPKDRPYLDVVIDSAGGDIGIRLGRVVKEGGIVVVYGATTGKDFTTGMVNVLRNQELRGSTMGSNREWKEAAAFIGKHRIVPIVDTVLKGLDDLEKGFQIMDKGTQFGKIVADLRVAATNTPATKL